VVEREVALGRRRVDERVGGLVLEGGDPAHAVLAVCTRAFMSGCDVIVFAREPGSAHVRKYSAVTSSLRRGLGAPTASMWGKRSLFPPCGAVKSI
jgi:hypothetical protein